MGRKRGFYDWSLNRGCWIEAIKSERQAQSPRTGAEKSGVINCNLIVRQPRERSG